MTEHHRELLAAARLLVHRPAGLRGRLPSARVRRSISTAYYAIFNYAQEECGRRLVGSTHAELRRRRIFARTLSHAGMLAALKKVAGEFPARDVAEFMVPGNNAASVPSFASRFALTFIEAQGQRHAADYDLNASLSEHDADRMISRVDLAIKGWEAAGSAADRDFKHALCLLITLRGRLRSDDA